MAGNLFDVFVVGASDPSAAGETRLAAALSAKHGVPLATITKAISAKNLRAGQSLEQAQAQALVRHLQSIGAVTVIRPAAAAGKAGAAPAPPRPANAQPTPAPMAGRVSVGMPAVGGGWPGGPAPLPNEPAADPFSHLPPPPQAVSAGTGGLDPFQPRAAVPTPAVAARPRQNAPLPSPAPTRAPGSALQMDVSPGPKLELARADRGGGGIDEEMSAARSRPAVSAVSLREMGMAGKSGVAMDDDPKNLNLVRCVQHGLYYDKTKASGCRKCMSPAREVAQRMVADATVLHVGGDLRRKPAKRAFLGLAFSLVLGFLPAVYYCFGPGAAEVRKLRVEQELLSRQPGTDEIMKRFDQLDGQVIGRHEAATRNTGIVWIAVATVSMLGWYKIT